MTVIIPILTLIFEEIAQSLGYSYCCIMCHSFKHFTSSDKIKGPVKIQRKLVNY